MANALQDLLVQRDPMGSSMYDVTPQIQQNTVRGPYMGCGTCPVPTGYQTAAMGAERKLAGLRGPTGRRSGSMMRAGRYVGSMGRIVNAPSQGRALREISTSMALADAGRPRGYGVRGLGGLGTVSPCDVARTTGAVGSFLDSILGAGTKSGVSSAHSYVTAGTGLIGSVCPPPAAPAPAVAPATGALTGGTDPALLALIQAQQAAQADRDARDAAKAASDAAISKQSNNTMIYAIGGGVALLAVVLLLRK